MKCLMEKENKTNWKFVFIIIVSLIVLVGIIILIINIQSDFKFKTLTSKCNNFNISGNIAYNSKKSSIYITNIEYCGKNENDYYQEIECILYEQNKNIEKRISSYNYNEKNITLEDFLKNVTFAVDDYQKTCNALLLE